MFCLRLLAALVLSLLPLRDTTATDDWMPDTCDSDGGCKASRRLLQRAKLIDNMHSDDQQQGKWSDSINVGDAVQLRKPSEGECERVLPIIDTELLSEPARKWYNSSSKLCAIAWEVHNGYGNRPPQDAWKQQLKKAFEGAQNDPCGADVLATMGWECGSACRLNSFASEVWLAGYAGWSLAVCGSEFTLSVFTKHFNLRPPICRSEMCRSLHRQHHIYQESSSGKWPFPSSLPGTPWSDSMLFQKKLASIDMAYVEKSSGLVYEMLFDLDAPTKARIVLQMHELGLSGTDTYIGVHIRRGDKRQEAELLPVEKYAEKVKEFINDEVNAVFLATDDKEMKASMESSLGSSVRVLELPRSNDAAYRWEEAQEDEQAILNLLADIYILSQATIFIGTRSSNVGQFVKQLRLGHFPSNSTIHADTGGWPVIPGV